MARAKPSSPLRQVRCYACGHAFGVGAKAVTARCPECTKHLNLRDVVIKRGAMLSRVETCGRIVVARKASLNAQRIVAGEGILVEGRCDADAVSGGTVRLARRARWKGDCAAPAIVVEPGALIEGGRFSVTPAPATRASA